MPVIAINGVDLHYDDAGSGDPVLFLAGPWFDRRLFRHPFGALEGFRRIALDLRGLGRSSGPTYPTVALDTLVSDVRALLDALGLPDVTVVGHDLGADVALALADRHPDRVRSLVLMGLRPAATRARLRTVSRVLRVVGPRGVAPFLPARLFGPAERSPARRRWTERFNRMPGGVAPILRGMAAVGPRPVVRCPALVLTGDAQPEPALAAALRVHEALPDSRLVRIPLAGSAMPVEQPDAVEAALRAFLARTVAPRTGDDHPRRPDLVF